MNAHIGNRRTAFWLAALFVAFLLPGSAGGQSDTDLAIEKYVKQLLSYGDIEKVNEAALKYSRFQPVLAAKAVELVIEKGTPVQYQYAFKTYPKYSNRLAGPYGQVVETSKKEIDRHLGGFLSGVFPVIPGVVPENAERAFLSSYDVPELANEKLAWLTARDIWSKRLTHCRQTACTRDDLRVFLARFLKSEFLQSKSVFWQWFDSAIVPFAGETAKQDFVVEDRDADIHISFLQIYKKAGRQYPSFDPVFWRKYVLSFELDSWYQRDTTIAASHGGDYTYVGRYAGGKRHGEGTMVFGDGTKYVGEWSGGQRQGKGICTYKDGSKYEGEWRGDTWHGRGDLRGGGGYRYSGQFANGKFNGKGTEFYVSGDRYEGAFVDGKRVGRGSYFWQNGNKHSGEWNDTRSGEGTYTGVDGFQYVGGWRNDKQNGYGVGKWSDGRIFTGQWSNANPDEASGKWSFEHAKYKTPNSQYVYATTLEAEGNTKLAVLIYKSIAEANSDSDIGVKAAERLRSIKKESEAAQREAEAAQGREREKERQQFEAGEMVKATRDACLSNCHTQYQNCRMKKDKGGDFGVGMFLNDLVDTTGCDTRIYKPCVKRCYGN
jgi:hypothetical protein